MTARALEHCCLVARPPPAVLRPQSLAFLLPDSGQLYLTAVGQCRSAAGRITDSLRIKAKIPGVGTRTRPEDKRCAYFQVAIAAASHSWTMGGSTLKLL